MLLINDLSGKNILTKHISEQSGKIDVSKMLRGCYFITVKATDGSEESKKMVVMD